MERNNPLIKLESLRQSIWLDKLSRRMLDSGELEELTRGCCVSGVTSNPAIFEKAISEGRDYDDEIERLARTGLGSEEIFTELATQDIRRAADLLRPHYDRTQGRDGFVSLEVSPRLARDTEATVAEAQRLWDRIGRPNVFIKVPATREGLPAIRRLIGEGININVTLLFGLSRYVEVAEAYLGGLESLAAREHSLEGIASVASFFLSRIDVKIDPMLESVMHAGGKQAVIAGGLRGQTAVASARVAWQIYKELFARDRFRELEARGARPQHLVWASTSTKTPGYSEVKYVDEIVAPGTINTMPMETLEAYRTQGDPAVRIEQDISGAYHTLERLHELGIDLSLVTRELEQEGIESFAAAYERLLGAIEQKRAAFMMSQTPHRHAA